MYYLPDELYILPKVHRYNPHREHKQSCETSQVPSGFKRNSPHFPK